MLTLGFIIFSIGACMADSECLAVPTVITFFGLYLMMKGAKNVE